jgi:hypothetical protein
MTDGFDWAGKIMVVAGLALAAVGGLIVLMSRLTGGHGLPGDIVVRRPGVTVYIPLATAIVLSIVLSLVLTLLGILWPRR